MAPFWVVKLKFISYIDAHTKPQRKCIFLTNL